MPCFHLATATAALVGVLLSAAVPGRAQTAAAANSFASADGDTAHFQPFFPGPNGRAGLLPRFQQVFAASQLASVPAGGAFITVPSNDNPL